jgi:uncharacterized protein
MTVWAIILSALALGFAGSLHCVGMCGPIALLMPLSSTHSFARLANIFLYLLGKSTTYCGLGVLMGFFGTALQQAGWQEGLSLALGGVLVAVVAVMWLRPHWYHQNRATAAIGHLVFGGFSRLMAKPTPATPFFMGLANGLLPCGLVYIGLTAAVALGTVQQAALFMWFFGMGTMPMLAAFVLLARQFGQSFKHVIRPLTPLLLLLMGCMLILRGLHIHLPGLTPAAHAVSCGR